MMKNKILMVENDSDDRSLAEEMFRSEGLTAEIDFIFSNALKDHVQNINYKPKLVLLSLNAQASDLSELIALLQGSENCRSVPIIVLSDIVRPDFVQKVYALGAHSLIKKPDNYSDTVFQIRSFVNYWFATVELPT
jgi:CheY-like chemotaxis protein